MSLKTRPLFLLGSLPFIYLAYSINLGFFSFPSISVLLLLFLSFLMFELKILKINFDLPFEKAILYLFTFANALNLFLPRGLYVENRTLESYVFLILIVQFFAIVSYFVYEKFNYLRFLLILLISIVSKILIILLSPSPKIDVYVLLQEAGVNFLKGINPYSAVYSQVYPGRTLDYFSYFPLSFLATLPSRVFFGDVRYTFIFTEAFVALLLFYFLYKKKSIKLGEYLSLLFISQPLSIFIIEESWLDPLVLSFFSLFVFSYLVFQNNKWFSYIFLAMGVLVKHNLIFSYIFALRYLRNYSFSKQIIALILPIIVFVLPFLILDKTAFLNDTFVEPFNRDLRLDSLNILSLEYPFFHISPNYLVMIFIAIYALIFVLKGNKSLFNFLYYYVFFLLGFSLFFKESFLNHYYFLSCLIILSVFTFLYEFNKP